MPSALKRIVSKDRIIKFVSAAVGGTGGIALSGALDFMKSDGPRTSSPSPRGCEMPMVVSTLARAARSLAVSAKVFPCGERVSELMTWPKDDERQSLIRSALPHTRLAKSRSAPFEPSMNLLMSRRKTEFLSPKIPQVCI